MSEKDLQIPICLGMDSEDNLVYKDLAKTASLFISGRAGTGRLMLLHNIMKNLTEKYTSDELKFLIINPGGLDFQKYKNSQYLYMPIIDTDDAAMMALESMAEEIKQRARAINEILGTPLEFLSREPRCKTYNETHDPKIPYVVVVIEETVDLILFDKERFHKALRQVCGLLANIHGIYTIVATQRIDEYGFTNSIRSFMPTRISFQTPTEKDSVNILGASGAKNLSDFGEILYSEMGYEPIKVRTSYLDYNKTD